MEKIKTIRTIDYTFKEIMADEQISNYLNCGEVKIRKCINLIEEKYFEGKRIYHAISSKKKSDFMFRFEIKGLLLLLLKLEIDEPIDGRAQKNGVSSLNIKKMLTPLVGEDMDQLNEYEYKLIVQYCDPEHVNTINDILNQTKKSLKRLAISYAKNYDNFMWGLSNSILRKIDQITKMIIGRTYGEDDIKIGTILQASNDLTKVVPSKYNTQIDLKQAVIKAIKRIIRDIYYFDEDNVCYRKLYLPKSQSDFKSLCNEFYKFQTEHIGLSWKNKNYEERLLHKHAQLDDVYYMEDKNDEILLRYSEGLKPINLEKFSDEELKTIRRLYKGQNEFELEEDIISEIQDNIKKILTKYYDKSCGNVPAEYIDYTYDEKDDERIAELKKDFTSYAELLYELQVNGLDNDKEYSLKNLIEHRRRIEKVIICDIEFDMHLSFFEKKFFDRYALSNYQDDQFLYEIINETINNFKKEIWYIQLDVENEYKLIDSGNYKNTPYELIEVNIKKINELIDELVNEVYAIIIRLR